MSFTDVKTPAASDPRALNQAAMQALTRGAAAEAKALLQQAVALDPAALPLQLNLATACRAAGDLDGAMAALERVLARDPRHFLALLMKASVLERRGETRLAGAAYGVALTQLPPPQDLDAATLKAVERARQVNTEYMAEMRAHMAEAVAGAASLGHAAESRRMNIFIDRMTGRRAIYQQQPTHFAYPGMPAIEFYDREPFPWIEGLEAETAAIRAEFLSVFADDKPADGFEPYVEYPDGIPLDQWAELNNSERWSAFHLLKSGRRIKENCLRCPNTLAALAEAPQPYAPHRSPNSMFSLLKAKTRIPAHTGVANTRLVVHLPLVLPPGCGFRVGSETREWRMGEAWVFDDTIDHEAWNDSDQPRAILIFDVWSPFLSDAEREVVSKVMGALDDFHGETGETGI